MNGTWLRRGAAFALLALGIACARSGAVQQTPVSTEIAASAVTSPPNPCPGCMVDPSRYLRQLSLDLRGRPPSFEELDAVVRAGNVPAEQIDTFLHTPEFLEQVRDWHKPLLWPNVDNFHIKGIAIADRVGTNDWLSPYPALAGKDQDPKSAMALLANFRRSQVQHGGDWHRCDPLLEYPPPASSGPQPTYVTVGSDKKKRTYPYYDPKGAPLPYHDAAHCPNFCTSMDATEYAAFAKKKFMGPKSALSLMNAPGADPKPSELDPPGTHCPATHPYRVVNDCDNTYHGDSLIDLEFRIEGFRYTKPYWSRGGRVKTCASEAQDREIGAYTSIPCIKDPVDATCGCGPEGVYCIPSPVAMTVWRSESLAERRLHDAINDEPLEIVATVVGGDEDYFDVFTTRRSAVTGPLSFFFRRQAPGAIPFAVTAPAPPEQIPALDYEDTSWHDYDRGPEHSGVLTTIAYLARFPTDRARSAHFRTLFQCRPFVPASDGSFPGPDDPCSREPDLSKRCGCKGCHASLEPMSNWFGKWAERSAEFVPEPKLPRADPKRVEEGARGLVDAAIASGELESCTIKTTWRTLVGRAMTEDEQKGRLAALEADFEGQHRRYRGLVRSLVTSPEYRGVSDRSPRRLSGEQLRASLLAATGFSWRARHFVLDPQSPRGSIDVPDADMLEVLAATLGEADYKTSVSDAIDPAVTFSKLAGDAARSACRASLAADLAEPSVEKRRLLRWADPKSADPQAVRKNLAYLALRFWGQVTPEDSADLAPLATLFERASAGASPVDGWRAVCIAMATDPQFLTY
ncbi:MAG TPA: hypothetical protein VGI39_34765 [Polyangiaceae bacterium]|jgi:hypothetical protein